MIVGSRLVFLGIIVILLVIYLPGYSKLQELKAKNSQLLDNIERLKNENSELTLQIKRLKDDPFYIEKKARDKMGIVKEGEIIYKVIDEHKESESEPESE